jgi:hypothetical protein
MQHFLPMTTRQAQQKQHLPMLMLHHPYSYTANSSVARPVLKPGVYQMGKYYETPWWMTPDTTRMRILKYMRSLPVKFAPINSQIRNCSSMNRLGIYVISNYQTFEQMAQARAVLHQVLQHRTNEMWQVAKDKSLIHFAVWIWETSIMH